MWPNPHWQQPTVGPQHSLPDPRLMSMKAAQRTGQVEAAPVPFLNPDPITHMVGHSNEAPVIMDRQKTTVLIDSGAQVSSISSQFCEELTLQILPMGRLLELEGTGGSTIPYLRFVEVKLQIPGIKNYNEDVLLLVIPTKTYSEKVLVMVGSKIIDQVIRIITKWEPTKVTMTWKQVHFGAIMSRSLQLPCTGSNGTGVEKDVAPSSTRIDTVEEQNSAWKMSEVQSTPHRGSLFPHLAQISVHSNTNVRGHCMWVHVLTEPMSGPQLPTVVVLIVTYRELHLGSSQVPICLCNFSTHSIKIPTKTVAGHLVPANQVPPVVLPRGTSGSPTAIPKRDGSWRPWTSKASGNGPNLSKNRPENYCSDGNTCLPTATWTWVKLL